FAVLMVLLLALSSTDGGPDREPKVEVSGTLEQQGVVARVTSAEAALKLPDGSRVRLEKGSEIVMPSPHSGRLIELRAGAGHFAVADTGEEFRVETPAGRVTALGPEFSVTLTHVREDESMMTSQLVLAVAVTYGLVLIETAGERCLLSAGQSRAFA